MRVSCQVLMVVGCVRKWLSRGAAASVGSRESRVPKQRGGRTHGHTDHPGDRRADQVFRGSGGLQRRLQTTAQVNITCIISNTVGSR